MHETVVAKEIVEEAKKQGNVKSILVEAGELARPPIKELKEILNRLTDWKINVTEKKARVKCRCGYIGRPKILKKLHGMTIFVCPKCGSVPEILDGRDIILKEVIVN